MEEIFNPQNLSWCARDLFSAEPLKFKNVFKMYLMSFKRSVGSIKIVVECKNMLVQQSKQVLENLP